MSQVTTQNQAPALVAGGGVNAIVPQTADEAYRLASLIHRSNMAPYGLDTPEKITIAVLQGIELGLPPMMALQSIAVINNRPCLWGDGLIGVVRQSPVCEYISEWIDGEGDDMIAVCETHRKGEPKPVKRTFSVDDAKRAGLWQTEARVTKRGKNGGTYEKDNDSPWYRYPKRMLQMRARALCLRDVYADILKGMQVREEVEDYQHQGPERAKDVTPQVTGADRLAAARQASEQKEQPEQQPEGFDLEHVNQTTAQAADQQPETDPEDEAPTLDLEPAGDAPLQEESENPAPVEEDPEQSSPEVSALDDFKNDLATAETLADVTKVNNDHAARLNQLSDDQKKEARLALKARKEEVGGEGK